MRSLWEFIADAAAPASGSFSAPDERITVQDLASGSLLAGALERLRGRALLLATKAQLPTAAALIELDGVARRIVLCTPDLPVALLAEVAAIAGAEAVVTDDLVLAPLRADQPVYRLHRTLERGPLVRRTSEITEWVLLTSGTTGGPKLVVHTLESLAGALPKAAPGTACVWSTFYDIRRYGGLQIYLRATLSRAPLVLSSAAEPTEDFLARAGAAGVTHVSGTPSHWRRALMSGAATLMQPAYVRLSGEVADQPLLDQLKRTYPGARIAHAFASTEAGVAFDVEDGRAGFPAHLIDAPRPGIELKVIDGTLRIRSGRTAARYLGEAPAALAGTDGYVDTGDLVERVGDRYYFRGRRGGVINVGGLKVYPEEVEAVINADPRVRMSLVKPRRNPITGAVVVADVVLHASSASPGAPMTAHVTQELQDACRRALAAHKVPAVIRIVPALEMTAAGKLVRHGA